MSSSKKSKKNDCFALVMAGGRGERFWPLSRKSKPKPYLKLFDGEPLINRSVGRINKVVPIDKIFVATNKDYVRLTGSVLPKLPKRNIISEPCLRDTAPCMVLVASLIASRSSSDNSVMIVLPSDHVINDEKNFASLILKASALAASTGKIVTIGIKPSFPSTGFGYIKCGDKFPGTTGKEVFRKGLSFVEKPDRNKAQKLISGGKHLWNSGIYIWTIKTFADSISKHDPDLFKAFEIFKKAALEKRFEKVVSKHFPSLERKSIDYAMMEKLDDFIVAEASFDWDDVGAWDSIRNNLGSDAEGNVSRGQTFKLNSKDNVVANYDDEHLLVLLDTCDMTVVHTPDATLVCPVSSTQKVKGLLSEISKNPKLGRFM